MELVCIVCPNGCRLTAEKTPEGLRVRGNTCPKGEKYGIEELSDPKRVVTAVVRTVSEDWPCVPVKTAGPIPKKHIRPLLQKLYSMEAALPVRRGQVCIDDIGGTGVPVVFTRSVPPAGKGASS
jgi:CxxC motif-containing protein